MPNWVYRFAGFVLTPSERSLYRDGEVIALTPKAFEVLVALVERHGRLVEKQELLSCVWPGTFVEETNLAYNISMLRKALGDSAEKSELIETIPKRGYRFIAAVSTAPGNPAYELAGVEAPAAADLTQVGTGGWLPRWAIWAGIAAAATLLMAGGWRLTHGSNRGVEFREPRLVLVAQFQNDTGEPALNGVLETALEAELTHTRFLEVASRERVNDALHFMRQVPASRVPAVFVREVCLRDPAIRAAITGSVRKIGATYLLTAEIIRPGDGRAASSITRSTADRNNILPAVGDLAVAIRDSLSERLPDRDTAKQEPSKVTTGSLEALTLYNNSLRTGAKGRWAEAEVLLRRAVELDPQFASAHLLLAWAIRNQRPAAGDEFMPFAERAMALAQSNSEPESLFISGSYYSLSGQHLKAVPFYEILVRDYPDHPWALNNLIVSLEATRQYARVAHFSHQIANMKTNNPAAQWQAIPRWFCSPNPDLQTLNNYLDRGMEIAQQSGTAGSVNGYQVQRAYYSAVEAWVSGDVDRSKTALDEMTKQLGDDDLWTALAAIGYMTLGQLGEADRLLERVTDLAVRLRWSIWRALLAGDTATARRMAAAMKDDRPNPLSAIAMIRAGEARHAAGMLKRYNARIYPDAALIAYQELAARRKHGEKWVEGLPAAVRSLSNSGLSERWLGTQILAAAYLARGDLNSAVSVLEETGAAARACGGFPTAVFWPQARYDLMRLYRRQNRFQEADAIRKELDRMLSLADANYSIRAALAEH